MIKEQKKTGEEIEGEGNKGPFSLRNLQQRKFEGGLEVINLRKKDKTTLTNPTSSVKQPPWEVMNGYFKEFIDI